MVKIAIFASGRGSNAEKIIQHLQGNESIKVSVIITNKNKAGVLDLAEKFNLPSKVIDRASFYESTETIDFLKDLGVSHIVLAGFLWKIPESLIETYPNKIINIHPALLPKYGGKGMYGHHVHQAVYDQKDKKSGITIHLVNQYYDEGKIIFQASCDLVPGETPDEIAARVLKLEHQHFPKVVEVWATAY